MIEEMLKQKLLENATSLLDWTSTAGEFVKEQVPLYVTELLEFRFYENMIDVIIYLAVLGFLVSIPILVLWFHRKEEWNTDLQSDFKTICVFAPLVVFFIVALFAFIPDGHNPNSGIKGCITQMVKIKVAPKVFIVEELKSIIKENSK